MALRPDTPPVDDKPKINSHRSTTRPSSLSAGSSAIADDYENYATSQTSPNQQKLDALWRLGNGGTNADYVVPSSGGTGGGGNNGFLDMLSQVARFLDEVGGWKPPKSSSKYAKYEKE